MNFTSALPLLSEWCKETRCAGCTHAATSAEDAAYDKERVVQQRLRESLGESSSQSVRPIVQQQGIEAYRYRYRVRLHARGQHIGYEKARSHDVLSFKHCPVLLKDFETRLVRLVQALTRLACMWGEFEVLFDQSSKQMIAEWVVSKKELDTRVVSAFPGFIDAGLLEGVVIMVKHGQNTERLRQYGLTHLWLSYPNQKEAEYPPFYTEAGVFTQANWHLNNALRTAVKQALRPNDVVLEWHAGSGNLTMAYAPDVTQSIVSEWDERAHIALRRNLEHASLIQSNKVKLCLGTDTDTITPWCHEQWPISLLLLDPPRRGAYAALKSMFTQLQPDALPKRIVYVSCHMDSWLKDARLLQTHYQLHSVTPMDMFVGTPHVELVTVFDRM